MRRSRLCWKAKVRLFHSYIVPLLLYSLSTLTLGKKTLYLSVTSIDGWYSKYLRRCLGVKASYYSHIPNRTVWIKAGRPTLPSQSLLTQQLDKLVDSIQKPSTDPIHHVIFSPGYKDRIKHSKSVHRGHPRPYWLDIISKQSVKLLHTFPDQSAIHRRDFLGVKYLITNK